MRHVNITISGRVQGVGFRWATLKKAEQFGIFGFVRNDPAGSLYIEAEGNPAALNVFLAWCKKGPLWAKVNNLEIADGPIKNFTTFEIVK